ncbi:hypothetical protein H5410_006636 [Solanum commersonii]|uniref:Uncharacterized protein n=1 Tax=Solanum commersonii TaxID=4109 RepID=A0A9J6AB33_SOLCO|nr:hypothetical protein H5410_006636 [Solanum commersonii]
MVAQTEKADMEAAAVGMEAARPSLQLRTTFLYCCDGGVAWRRSGMVAWRQSGMGGDGRR